MVSSAALLEQRLVSLLARHSVQRGDFTLASGKRSSYYVDARLTTMRPEGLCTIGPLSLEKFQQHAWEPSAVGGLTLGADPIAYAIAYASAELRRPIRAFSVRKAPKEYGTHREIEGPLLSDDHIVIIEDVITSGSSALRAVDAVRRYGATVIGVLAVVDREEDGMQRLRATGLQCISLTRISQLLDQTTNS